VTALAFSPSGRHFAVGCGRLVELWYTPETPDSNASGELEFAPFIKYKAYAGHHDSVTNLVWSGDSRFILSTSKDLTARVWSLEPEAHFVPTTLAGHREAVVGAWFSKNQETIFTVSKDGAVFEWQYTSLSTEQPEDAEREDNLQWRIVKRNYFLQPEAKVTCAAFHESGLLVTGFSSGIFTLHEMPDFILVHTLSISQSRVDIVSINTSGEWLAFGSAEHGQLLVWEWQSESYILKQQGHFDSTNALAYSPDGQRIITASDDGKLKVWDVTSGFCIVTFTEHTGAVTSCEFAKRGNIMFSASLDGSIRAWDLVRYRNFRTFTAPQRLSFSSLAVDPSGEVVCAGSVDSFDIHIWSVQTGQMLDQLSGHEGPVVSLSFLPNGLSLISGSWDNTVRIWNIFQRTQTSEPLQLQSDILCVATRPDSKQIAVASLDGQLTFWSVDEGEQEGVTDGRRDVSGGRKMTDRRAAVNISGTKNFRSVSYSADGTCVLAGGNSKYICLYDVQSGALVKKFTVTVNLSIDGTQEYLNSNRLTEAGPEGLIDQQGEASDLEDRIDRTLPGAQRGKYSKTRQRPEIRVNDVAFSPTGRAFCAAATEGLLIYSLDDDLQFDPFDLDTEVTPENTILALEQREFLKSLVMALRLNEAQIIRRVFESIPPTDIGLVSKAIPLAYLSSLLRFVAKSMEESPHLEYNLLWIQQLMSHHGRYLKTRSREFGPELRMIQKGVSKIQNELAKL
jgi:periodic tryptophan protein 2